MNAIRIERVDERTSGWENPQPRFRVYLHESGADSTRGATATYDVTGADVLQVIDWAQKQAGDSRTYAVALVYDDEATEQRNPGFGRGLVWLVGGDGNDTPLDALEADRQRRMLQRRADPVRIPVADQMPLAPDDPSFDGSAGG
ncbi:MAG: hypothetical protein ACTHKG_11895 [Nocardioides sp.]